MVTKKAKRSATNAKRSAKRATRKAGEATAQGRGAVQDAWKATVDVYTAIEAEAEKQIRTLMQQGRVSAQEARTMIAGLSDRAQKERKRAARELDTRIQALQARMAKERKAMGRVVDDAVRSGLASFNIPSRQEVSQLTRKVEELSRKIDGFKAPARRRVTTVKVRSSRTTSRRRTPSVTATVSAA